MHSFGDVSPNISQRSKLEIFDIEDDLLSNFRPFILNNIDMGKWVKPDLSDLENDLLNNSIKPIS